MPEPAISLAAVAASDAVRTLFLPGCGVGACRDGAAPAPFPTEAAAVRNAVGQRRAEFAAGRAAARAALGALGARPAAIPMGADRAPRWPWGLAGSITHADGLALAVVGHLPRVFGLDAEPDLPLPPELLPLVFPARAEQRLLAGLPDPLRLARAGFAAKEAAYKCQYQRSGTLLDFGDLSIEALSPPAATLRLVRRVGPYAAGAVLHVRLARAGGLILAGCHGPSAEEHQITVRAGLS